MPSSRIRFLLCYAALAGLLLPQTAFAATSSNQLCASPMLTAPERDQCHQDISRATSAQEIKDIRKKYQDRIRKAEAAKKVDKKG